MTLQEIREEVARLTRKLIQGNLKQSEYDECIKMLNEEVKRQGQESSWRR